MDIKIGSEERQSEETERRQLFPSQKAGSPHSLRSTQAWDTLILGFRLSERRHKRFLLFETPPLWEFSEAALGNSSMRENKQSYKEREDNFAEEYERVCLTGNQDDYFAFATKRPWNLHTIRQAD